MPLPYSRAALIALALLSCGFANPAIQREQEMLNPTVGVDCGGGSGSGTVIHSAADGVFILTNQHVIADEKKCTAHFYATDEVGATTIDVSKPISVVAADSDKDLALLKVAAPFKAPSVAALAPEGATIYAGEDAYVAGAGHGHRVYLTHGLIGVVDDSLIDEHVITMSAPIVPGNSGGSLWHIAPSGHYEMIGIPEAMETEQIHAAKGGPIGLGVGISTMGLAIPMATVREFLADTGNGSVLN